MSALDIAARAQIDALPHVGVTATVTPDGGSARTVRVFFDAMSLDDFGVLQPQPQMRAISADVADLADGDSVVIGGVSYRIRAMAADPFGLVTARLGAA